jgi:hypothetical protein
VETERDELEEFDDDKALVFLAKPLCNMFNRKLDSEPRKIFKEQRMM